MRFNWDFSGLELAASVLFQINRRGQRDAASIASYIRTIAERECLETLAAGETPSYVGTGGWYVTFFQPTWAQPDEWRTLVTIQPYSVAEYLRECGLRQGDMPTETASDMHDPKRPR